MSPIEVKGIIEDVTAGAVSVQLSAVPSPEWVGFFGQAWVLGVVEGAIPTDFGRGSSVQEDRIVIPEAWRESVFQQMDGLRRIVDETNRITASYHALQRRSYDPR